MEGWIGWMNWRGWAFICRCKCMWVVVPCISIHLSIRIAASLATQPTTTPAQRVCLSPPSANQQTLHYKQWHQASSTRRPCAFARGRARGRRRRTRGAHRRRSRSSRGRRELRCVFHYFFQNRKVSVSRMGQCKRWEWGGCASWSDAQTRVSSYW